MKCVSTGSNNAASNYHDLEPTRLRLSFFRFISQLQSIYSPPVMKQDLYLYVWSLLYLSQESRCSCFHGFSFLIKQLHWALSAWSIFRSRCYIVISVSHQRRRKTPLIVALWAQILRPNSLDIRRSSPTHNRTFRTDHTRFREPVARCRDSSSVWHLWNRLRKVSKALMTELQPYWRWRVEGKSRLRWLHAWVSTLDKWMMLKV